MTPWKETSLVCLQTGGEELLKVAAPMAARSAQRPNLTIAQTGLPKTLVSL